MTSGQPIRFTSSIDLYDISEGDHGKFIEPHLHYDGQHSGASLVSVGRSKMIVPNNAFELCVEHNASYEG